MQSACNWRSKGSGGDTRARNESSSEKNSRNAHSRSVLDRAIARHRIRIEKDAILAIPHLCHRVETQHKSTSNEHANDHVQNANANANDRDPKLEQELRANVRGRATLQNANAHALDDHASSSKNADDAIPPLPFLERPKPSIHRLARRHS